MCHRENFRAGESRNTFILRGALDRRNPVSRKAREAFLGGSTLVAVVIAAAGKFTLKCHLLQNERRAQNTQGWFCDTWSL